ncbi:GumC family protein [Rosistilla oblonga]|uniref:GumC family protein n=1 Tax=Rosistilla oblonga TaxID=2527990 RepID=UPI003A98153B
MARRRRNTAADSPLTLFDIFAAVLEYRWRAAFTFLLVLALSLVAIVLFPKKYESEAKMFVRLGRGSVTMDTTATTGQTISIQESRESEINSITDMLQSRQLAEDVVNAVGADRILEKHSWIEQMVDRVSAMMPEMPVAVAETGEMGEMTPEQIEQQERFESAVRYVIKNTKINSPKKSTTITVVCRARTPQLAQDLTTKFLESHNRMHLDAYKSPGSYKFFEENFAEHERMVSDYEDAMREAKNDMVVITIEGKQQSLQEQVTSVQKEIINASAELFSARASLLDLMADMERLPEEMATETTRGIANEANDKMRDRLYELEIREKDLASKYKSVHPKLVTLRQQLNDSKTILASQEKEREHNVMSVNPVRQDVHKSLLTEKSRIAGLEAKVDALRMVEQELNEELQKVNSFELTSSELRRRIRIADNNHRIYAQKLEESRINNALDQEAISNVSIVQKPSFVMKHVSPKRSLLGALGFLMSMLCGVFVAVASDRFRGVDDDYAKLDQRLAQIESRATDRVASEPGENRVIEAAESEGGDNHHSDGEQNHDDHPHND